jgi:hypothetical protein
VHLVDHALQHRLTFGLPPSTERKWHFLRLRAHKVRNLAQVPDRPR